MRKVWNYLMCISLFLTLLVPITGVLIHKLSATIFILLCIFHCMKNKNRLSTKYYLLWVLLFICFVSGVLGMAFSGYLIFHKVMALLLVCFLVEHIYLFHKKLKISLKN